MSLFKDITDELEQAVNDIVINQAEDDDGLFAILSESNDIEVEQELLDSILKTEETTNGSEFEGLAEVIATFTKEETPAAEEILQEEESSIVEETIAVKEELKREVSVENRNAVTVITKGTTINGSIISDCSLDVMGTINGDIECLGKLTITGKVTGNSLASEVVVSANRLTGSIISEGNIKVCLGTVIVGDITAASAVFAGAVKGEIDVKGPVVLESTAIIKGNIKAKSIYMENGAVMDGFCSLCYADLKIDDIFE